MHCKSLKVCRKISFIILLLDKVINAVCAKCFITKNIEKCKMCTYCFFTSWGRNIDKKYLTKYKKIRIS